MGDKAEQRIEQLATRQQFQSYVGLKREGEWTDLAEQSGAFHVDELGLDGMRAVQTSDLLSFQNENDTELSTDDWWLVRHMELATDLLCLEHSVEVIRTANSVEAERLSACLHDLAEVRDGLYELYLHADHPRVAAAAFSEGHAFPEFIRSIYESCSSIVSALRTSAREGA